MKQLTKISLTLITLFTMAVNGFAQNSQINRTNHWYFGGQAGLDFSSGTAVADTNGQLLAYSGCASISDTAGNLLIYTEGTTVWNKNHQIMPNGTGLLGDGTPKQSSIIIPKPLDDNSYYILTLSSSSDGTGQGIRYSIVDMTLDGGLGNVTVKNQLLFNPSSEQLAATMHANCEDVWIMGHEIGSDNYRSYLLTSNGIDTNSVVINTIGNHPKNDSTGLCGSCMGFGLNFSPNGKKMASNNYWANINTPQNLDTLELFDFDNATGLLSNLIKLPDTTIAGFNFSIDNKLLYVSNFNTEMANLGIPCFAEILQYDISSNNASLIQSSRTRISCPLDSSYDYNDIQIAKDNKMYITSSFSDSLSVINYPNNLGISCDLQEMSFSLDGRICYTALPNFISSYFNQDSTGCFYTNINDIKDESLFISAYPNPFSVSTTITIESISNPITDIEASLFDVVGKKINIPIQQNSNKFILYRDNLKSGIYILKLTLNNKNYTQKLIIH